MTDDIRSQFEALNGQWEAAFRQGDSMAIATLYTVEGQLLPPNSEPVTGRDAISGFWQGVLGMGLSDVTLETLEAEAHDDTGVEVGRYELRTGDGSVADHGKYVYVWKRVGGDWKIHRDIWASSQPAPA